MPNWYACFTSCDTVSAFAGREKITALRLVKQQTPYREMFKQLGMEWVLSDMLFQSLQEFTCKIYCSQPGTDNINGLRYRLFCAKKGNIDSTQLPPCIDCLFKHAARANFQAAIWKRRLQSCQGTRPPLVLAGARMVITLPLTGWAVTQPLQPCYNYCLARVQGHVNFLTAVAWQMVWNARMCASD